MTKRTPENSKKANDLATDARRVAENRAADMNAMSSGMQAGAADPQPPLAGPPMPRRRALDLEPAAAEN
jgi:hypothetical protein